MPWLGASPSLMLRGMTVVEDAILEELADVPRHLLPEIRALVVHRQQHAGDVEAGIEGAADAAQRGDEIGEPFEREVLAVERNQHRVGGDERVEREQAERRRRVDEDEVEAIAQRRPGSAQPALAIRSATSSTSAPVRLRSAGISDRFLIVRRNDDGRRCPACRR